MFPLKILVIWNNIIKIKNKSYGIEYSCPKVNYSLSCMLGVLTHTHNYLLFVHGSGLIYWATAASDRGFKLVPWRVSHNILFVSSCLPSDYISFKIFILTPSRAIYKHALFKEMSHTRLYIVNLTKLSSCFAAFLLGLVKYNV